MKPEQRKPPQMAKLFSLLDHYGIRYVLFGTTGLVAYGAQALTGDLDICPDPSQENLERLAHLLTDQGEQCEHWQKRPLDMAHFDSLFETAFGTLDVVPSPYGPHGKTDRFSYMQLEERAITKTAFDVAIRVACFEDLVASKLSAKREKDLRLLPEIERLSILIERGEQPGWPVIPDTPS